MNVYDFDNTIYSGDCTLDFWKYCVRKYPKIWYVLPAAIVYGALFTLRLCSKALFKEKFYRFLKYVPDVDDEICKFWDCHIYKIKDFYYKQHHSDDVVVSASPEFLIREVCTRLGVAFIASKVDPATGKLGGDNCYGEEKVRRFREMYPGIEIQEFYTDSVSDIFMAKQAQKAFLVENDRVEEWSV